MKLFFSMDCTTLSTDGTPISLGIIDEEGRSFYAEFDDFKKDDIDDWAQDNIISNLRINEPSTHCSHIDSPRIKGNTDEIRESLIRWLSSYRRVEFWGDFVSYDWVALNQLWGGNKDLPIQVDNIPFDLCTLMKVNFLDPYVDLETFTGMEFTKDDYPSLYRAKLIKKSYEKVVERYANEY